MSDSETNARPTLSVDGDVDAPFVTEDRSGAVATLLDAAQPRADADHATVHGGGDGYLASIPLVDLRRGLLADGRLTIPEGRTLCWNVKDVVRIEVTRGKAPDSVPENPPH